VHDLKILFEMNQAVEAVSRALDEYKFNEAAKELYDFVWGDFCDWYIEASKVAPNITVLDKVLRNILRLLHPFAPFITEELWRGMWAGADTIQLAEWPQPQAVEGATAELAAQVNSIYEVVGAARQLRNEYGISPKTMVNFIVEDKKQRLTAEDRITILRLIGNCNVTITNSHAASADPSRVTNSATIFMMGAVDIEVERQRLTKQLADIDKQLAATDAKLANESFVSKAAPIAVQRERDRQQQLREQRDKVRALLGALQ
jgi:valyl-tRNA synthetase